MSEKKIGRPKVNPNYNPEAAKDALANAVAELYLHPSSDMEVDKDGHARMKSLQLHFGLTMTKIRKLLVSAGVYHFYKNGTDVVEAVQKLYNEGHTIEEIKSKLHIGTSTINSFLPYKIGTYKADFTADDYDFANVSAEARRKRNQRKREKMKDPKAVGLREENIKKMEKQRKIKDMKAKHKAENEARHQANLERKRAYQERKALKERNDPGNYFWLIKQAREAGIESHARHLERSRDVYLRREAGEVIPQKVASAYINNDPLPEYQGIRQERCDFNDEERKVYDMLRRESADRIASFYDDLRVEGNWDRSFMPIRIDEESLISDLNDLLFALTENHKSEFIKQGDVAAFDVLLEKLVYKLRFFFKTSPMGRTVADKMIEILKGVGTDDDMFPEYEIRMIQDAVRG